MALFPFQTALQAVDVIKNLKIAWWIHTWRKSASH